MTASPQKPIKDTRGTACHAGQSGPVWFLAGSYKSNPVVRTCTIPQGEYLFFPMINALSCAGEAGRRCKDLQASVKESMDSASNFFAQIDATAISNLLAYRETSSECFDPLRTGSASSNLSPVAANGYWVMVKPLPSGKHTLHLRGQIPGLKQNITYYLTVE